MFLNLAPITESPGMALMKKMGWNDGQGLGKDATGDVNPLTLCVKTDRKGMSRNGDHSANSTKTLVVVDCF